MKTRIVIPVGLEQFEMSPPNGSVVSLDGVAHESSHPGRPDEIVESVSATGSHHVGRPVGLEAVRDGLDEIFSSLLEEEAIGDQDRVETVTVSPVRWDVPPEELALRVETVLFDHGPDVVHTLGVPVCHEDSLGVSVLGQEQSGQAGESPAQLQHSFTIEDFQIS